MAGLVVLHVSDEPEDVARAISAADLITRGEPMRVQIVVNGPAVAGLQSGDLQVGEAVRVFACERAMARHGVERASLTPEVQTVASAVVALANAQHDGAAYIRI